MAKAQKKPQRESPYKHSVRTKGDLTIGSINAHLVRLTVPMIWGLLAIISVQLVDTYFISLLGTTELAGISFTFPITMIITHLLFGLNVAISSVVSRLLGEKKEADAKRVTLHALMMAFIFSTSIALCTYVFLEPLFKLLGADAQTLPVVLDYMPVWLVASVILAVPVNGNSAIRAGGDSFSPAIIMVMIAVINCILDPILIFGYFGLPALGVAGAAWATLIAYVFGFFGGVFLLVRVKKAVALDGLHLDKFKDSLKRLIFIAIPAGIANIIMPLSNAVIVAILAGFGTEAVAAYGIVSRVEAMAFLAVIALSVGMAPIIGQNWGAQSYGRVHQTIKTAINFNFVWSFGVAIILSVFAIQVASVFSKDPAVIYYAKLFFWIVPFSYAFGNLVFGWSSSFNAIGKPERSLVMIVVKAFVLTIPAVYIGSWLGGVIGIFVALAVVNVVSGLFFHILSWRHCRASEEARVAGESNAVDGVEMVRA